MSVAARLRRHDGNRLATNATAPAAAATAPHDTIIARQSRTLASSMTTFSPAGTIVAAYVSSGRLGRWKFTASRALINAAQIAAVPQNPPTATFQP
jgi:hypothetical protein